MKIYEYAQKRNIKSKDIVTKLHEMGFTHIKNHLSLVPEKVLTILDEVKFEARVKERPTPLHIAMVSMECAPFLSKGLGDMVKNKIQYNLLNGNNVIVIVPKYNIDKVVLTYLRDFKVTVYHKERSGKIYYYTNDKVKYYFIESDYYFNREKLYGFYDDAERFAFLAKAAIEIIKEEVAVDIVNIHDWPFGLFPLLFKTTCKELFPSVKIEFSVYGSTYQGIYGKEVLVDVFGLDESDYETVEYASSVNFLKAGLVTADKIDINKVALEDLKNSYLRDYIYDNN